MIRQAAVAGSFYPKNARQLGKDLDRLLKRTEPKSLKNLKGIIVPHAGYLYSAQVAAQCYRQLLDLPSQPYNVFLLGPAHHVSTTASLGLFEAFETPLGRVGVNQEICNNLLTQNTWLQSDPAPHLPEHSLEVQIPFLQKTLKDFRIVPILLGDARPGEIAEILAPYFLLPDSLFVFSSDLSHYHPYQEAREIDHTTLEIVRALDLNMAPRMEACGDTGLAVAMSLARKFDFQIELLDYRNSGDTAGDKNSVVGYAALAIVKSPK